MIRVEDRRVRKTKKAMMEALAKLLSKKPLNSISVREISELADINRGTFYLHYRDVYDMVEKLQSEIFERFNDIVDNRETEENDKKLFPMLVELFNLLADNSELAIVLLGKNGDAAFVDRLKQVVHEKCFVDAKKVLRIKNDDKFDYFYYFVVSGCIGIFSTWLNNGMQESSAEMASFTEKFILNGVKTFS